ncbi:MAG: hypothetical protein JW929_13420 [Anaerolineales bacterium]|nr:hypothetical protein [Anaerolineales bacterium]
MDIDRSAAESALASIREAENQMNRAQSASGGAYQMIIWGTVMMIGYTLTQFADRLPVALVAGPWIVMSTLGNILSVMVNVRRARKFLNPYGARLGFLYAVFLLFGVVGAFFVHPSDPREINLLVYLMTMLWMAAMGLWVDLRLLWVSLAFTALMLFGYLVLPDYFFLWLALVGGGALIGSGLLLLRGRA